MSRYVYSTASASVDITLAWGPDMLPARKVTIKGGHGIADKHFWTPQGVMTEVPDNIADELEKNAEFQAMVKAGFATLEAKRVDAEKVASNLEGRDGSAPIVPQDYELKGKKAPKTGKAED